MGYMAPILVRGFFLFVILTIGQLCLGSVGWGHRAPRGLMLGGVAMLDVL